MLEGALFWAAEDLSAFFKPPWWRPVHWLRWRRKQQPSDVYRAFCAAIRGEPEPVRRYGINLNYSTPDAPVDQILRQMARLKG